MRIFALTDFLILRWEVLLPAALVLACAAMLTLMYLVGPAIAGLFVIGALFSWIAAASVARSAASRRSMRRISPEIALWSGGTRRSPDVALPYRAATIVAFGPLALANVLVVVADLALRIAIPEVDTASRAILVLVGNSIGALRSYAPREWFEIRRDEIVRLSRWTSSPLQGDVVRVEDCCIKVRGDRVSVSGPGVAFVVPLRRLDRPLRFLTALSLAVPAIETTAKGD